MTHLSEEELLALYYEDEAAGAHNEHVWRCGECEARLRRLRDELNALREYPVPERGEQYGREVWARIAPAIERKRSFRIFWILSPVLAAMLVAAFFAGSWTEHKRSESVDHSRERVLLMAMSEHLERSQVVLTELLHANPATFDLATERDRARDLIDQNRLLRQTALHLGDRSHAALLDDLERVLLAMANSPAKGAADDTKMLQERVENDQLLWKVRVTSSNAREKGQKL
jgi:hypothetical protein